MTEEQSLINATMNERIGNHLGRIESLEILNDTVEVILRRVGALEGFQKLTVEEKPLKEMTLLELLNWDHEMTTKEENVEWEEWLTTIDKRYPFSDIAEKIELLQNEFENITERLEKLINILDSEVGGVTKTYTLKEWMKNDS